MKQVTFWDITDLDRNEVYYHAVHGNVFGMLQNQAEDGEIILWGRNEDEDKEWRERGKGEVSCSSFDTMQVSIDNFFDENGMIFILAGENPRQYKEYEYLITTPEWKIVGGLRPTEDPEVFQLYTIEEMVGL
ncbi:MAG TPA: hypothetical protein VHV10_20110 [Ktedonobacteraceae bacterium]|jgi:hypothetical protein|nr:hypothetical protein [Ktedonobacteraceae bacterium]